MVMLERKSEQVVAPRNVTIGERFSITAFSIGRDLRLQTREGWLPFRVQELEFVTRAGEMERKLVIALNQASLKEEGRIVPVPRRLGPIEVFPKRFTAQPDLVSQVARIRLQEFDVPILGRVEHTPSVKDVKEANLRFAFDLPIDRSQILPRRFRFVQTT